MEFLSFKEVSYRYGPNWAVCGIEAQLKPGITGLVGPNGAGKTTLMRLAIGLIRPTGGKVQLFGDDPHRVPKQRLRVGYLPQNFDVPRSMRVGEYVEMLGLLSGYPRARIRSRVMYALSAVGLEDRHSDPLGVLSGGMIRRVGMAQALVHDPQLLIVDEPTTGLDPQERARLYNTLREESFTRPVLVSSHQVDEVEREADHVWILSEGRLVWWGNVSTCSDELKGMVRAGWLPDGEEPTGLIVGKRRADGGTVWRAIGNDQRLGLDDPTLHDAYMYHVGGARGYSNDQTA